MSSSSSSVLSLVFSMISNPSLPESLYDEIIGLCAGREAKLRLQRNRLLRHWNSLPDTPAGSQQHSRTSSSSSGACSLPIITPTHIPKILPDVEAFTPNTPVIQEQERWEYELKPGFLATYHQHGTTTTKPVTLPPMRALTANNTCTDLIARDNAEQSKQQSKHSESFAKVRQCRDYYRTLKYNPNIILSNTGCVDRENEFHEAMASMDNNKQPHDLLAAKKLPAALYPEIKQQRQARRAIAFAEVQQQRSGMGRGRKYSDYSQSGTRLN